MKNKLLLSCIIAISGWTAASAQPLWSLEDCIRYAYEHNLQVKRQELQLEYNRNNYVQSYFNTLPNMNGSLYNSFSSGKTIDYAKFEYVDQNYWSSNMQLSSSLTLFSGLQNYHNILYSRYTFLKNQADLEKARNDIAVQLALAYLQVLFAGELVNVAQNQLEVTTMQTERNRKMLEAGNMAQGHYLQFKAQEANDRTALVNARNNLDMAYLDLTQMLDLDSVDGFKIEEPQQIEVELAVPLESVETIYKVALGFMPQIRSAEYNLKSSQKQLAMAWGQVSPTISLSGSLSTRFSELATDPLIPDADYPYLDQLKDYYYKQVSVVLSVPIFNRLQVRSSISNARLSLDDTELQLEMARKALYKEVQQALADALAALEKYNASLEAVHYNDEAFKYTQQQYELGSVNVVDYNMAQGNLTKAMSDMLQAKYDYIFKRKILDLYMDRPITF